MCMKSMVSESVAHLVEVNAGVKRQIVVVGFQDHNMTQMSTVFCVI